jgi:2,3-bisphosphoglycerate-dependent phosphoglycerate mutase
MQQATRIIAVRHGETTWNLDARIQGQTDIDLNDTGRWQARRVGQALAQEPISAVYSSDLMRAHETARSIGEAVRIAVIQAQNWRKRLPEWQPPNGGESLLQLRERVVRTVEALAARHAGEQIVVVAHGGVLDALYRIATGQAVNSPRTWELPNGAINRLLWSPEGFTLIGWSDTQHLADAPADETTA